MNLGIDFYKKLIEICQRQNVKPEDLLKIMTLESGLNPSAVNKDGGAAGLVQFMPHILKKVYKYNPSDYKGRKFNELSGLEQLDTIEKHLANLSRGRGFKSAAQLYIGNFFPVALGLPGVQAMNPDTVIVEKNPTTQKYKAVSLKFESRSYESNKGLDSNKDGKITYGDIDAKMNGASGSKIYKDALRMLEEARKSIGNGSENPKNDEVGMESSLVNQIENLLKSVANNVKYYNIKNSDVSESCEIARAISNILYKEGINSFIMTNGDRIQLKVSSNLDIKQMIEEDILEDSENMNYKIASPQFQSMQYRKCIIKGING